MMCRIPVVPTGARIHRGDEHKGAWVLHRIFRTTDGDFAVFERLTEHFEGGLVEFGQFIEKEHSMMSHTHFTRQRSVTATRHCHL